MKTLDIPWVYEDNPQMRFKSYDNEKIVEDLGWYRRMSPASDEHREYIVSIFREIVTDYDIDAILLQDDLYWGSDEVYDDYSKRAYFEVRDKCSPRMFLMSLSFTGGSPGRLL